MKNLSDEDILNELKRRFLQDKMALESQKNTLKQLQELNARLKEPENSKSGFLSNIRNEILNPFTGILELSSSIMTMGAEDLSRIHNMARLIFSEASDLDFQFKNIFEAAAIEAGESVPDPAISNVVAIVKNAIHSLQHKVLQKEIRLELSLPAEGEDLYFNTDPEKLSLIVLNLLSNAIKFNKAAGTINLKLEIAKGMLLVAVEDNGIGIKKSDENQIFDRFKKIGTENTYGGYGLGLSVSASLAELLNGKIEFCSKKSRGSIFTLTIPELPLPDEFPDQATNGNEVFFSPQNVF